jgi:putative transposase
MELGSAYPVDERITMEIKGRHLIEGVPKTISITDEEIRESLAETVAAAKKKAQQKKAKKKAKGGKPGRPKGSKNRNKSQVVLTPELLRIQRMIGEFLALAGNLIKLTYLVLDGHFGNNNALQMVLGLGLHLVCKLRSDSALYFQYEGDNKRKKYGDKIDYANLPKRFLKESTTEDGVRTDIYQATIRHKEFACPLNVVIIFKTILDTGASARVILFSSDLQLAWDKLLNYYQLRFQIEFIFRDAKQYWGLEDFMNVKETPVTNAINQSIFMVSVSQVVLRDLRQEDSTVNVLDLKAIYRGHKYVTETLKLLPQKPDPILSDLIFDRISRLGRVHNSLPRLNSS